MAFTADFLARLKECVLGTGPVELAVPDAVAEFAEFLAQLPETDRRLRYLNTVDEVSSVFWNSEEIWSELLPDFGTEDRDCEALLDSLVDATIAAEVDSIELGLQDPG
ncbi:hypothetical protein [Allokutzneria albata]|uniref:Uncharacterized protein n=1 Tax=Allokutzneria albata TaxID=211114 RepID=A0A1H0CYP3_ALLAB|nr:hypothetical protein [Allokutzneria albata]SDN63024.1 hypothetical protein SAMN04489726_7491 [Allokutzneria albata]